MGLEESLVEDFFYTLFPRLSFYLCLMTIITIQANDSYGHQLYQKLKTDKNLKKVTIEEPASSGGDALLEIEATLPGSALSEVKLLKLLAKASREKNLSITEARKRTAAKIIEK